MGDIFFRLCVGSVLNVHLVVDGNATSPAAPTVLSTDSSSWGLPLVDHVITVTLIPIFFFFFYFKL